MKKAQGLPMTTVVLIIMILVALAVILIFFFTSFGRGGAATEEQNIFSKCQSLCTKIQADIALTSSPTSFTVASYATSAGYCDYDCDKYMSCDPRNLCTTNSRITCSGASAICS